MKPDNTYLKTILEKVGGDVTGKRKSNNRYLREISENIGSGGGGGDVDLRDYIKKSSTSGLVKNDGTIDTTQYLSQHQDISGKLDASELDTVEVTVTYTDDSTTTYNLAVWSDE